MTNAADATESQLTQTPVTCGEVTRWLQIGPLCLNEAALSAIAAHIESCAACDATFDSVCLQLPSPHPQVHANGAESARAEGDIRSFIASELLAAVDARRAARANVAVLRPHPLGDVLQRDTAAINTALDASTGHLAPGRILVGANHRFVVKGRIGIGDFTETYLAERVQRSKQRQAVAIKIPRVPHDVSADVAEKRLHRLSAAIRLHTHDLAHVTGVPSVAQMVDCGKYEHRLGMQSAESTFIAYQYVEEASDLPRFLADRYSSAGRFTGVRSVSVFAAWAKTLARGVANIHNARAIHGAICPANILVRADGTPIFIDIGEWLFPEMMNGTKEFSGYFYRAPEGVYNTSSDLFSLGAVLYYCATGKDPIGLGDYDDIETLKTHVEAKIRKANPQLHREDAGVSDIIAMCARRRGRVSSVNQLLEELETFWPTAQPASLTSDLKDLTYFTRYLDRRGSPLYRSVANQRLRQLRSVLADMTKGNLDISSGRNDMRRAACTLLGSLGPGDQFLTVSLPAFWEARNIGTKGRFLSACRNAAARGATVQRVLLLDERLCDRSLQAIVAAQLKAGEDIDPACRSHFAVRYILMVDEERRQRVFAGQHFGLLVKGNDQIAMFPVYDDDVLVALQFRSGPRQLDGLRETFESLWCDARARPLVDLTLDTSRDFAVSILEDVG